MGPDTMIFVFWMLSFRPTFSLSSSLSSRGSLVLLHFLPLSGIRVLSSAYLRLLRFLPAILIPACVSSSPAFLMMHSAYKLNKQGDNIQPWRTPFPICNQSVVQITQTCHNCLFNLSTKLKCNLEERKVNWKLELIQEFCLVHMKIWGWSCDAVYEPE